MRRKIPERLLQLDKKKEPALSGRPVRRIHLTLIGSTGRQTHHSKIQRARFSAAFRLESFTPSLLSTFVLARTAPATASRCAGLFATWQIANSHVAMESLDDTLWDVIICGTGLQQSLLALYGAFAPSSCIRLNLIAYLTDSSCCPL